MDLLPIEFVKVDLSTEEFNQIGVDLAVVMVQSNLASTKSEARRHILAGAFRINDQVVKDPFARLACKENQIIIVEHTKPPEFVR